MRTIAALLCAVATLATACGGSASTDLATQPEDSVATTDSQSFADIEYRSPISDFLGQDVSGFDFDEAAEIERARERERQTADCMREKGFEYIPQDASQITGFSGPPQDEFEPGSPEWINKYGFGISTQRFSQSMVGDLVGSPDEQFFGPSEDFVDPNQEYVEGLTAGEREAYQEALNGQLPDFGPEGPSQGPDEDWRPSGCRFAAFEDIENSNIGRFYQAFGDELQTMRERIQADSRVISFNAEVAACVAEEGLTWDGIENVYQQFEPRLNQLQASAFSSTRDPFEEAGLDPETMSERELREFYIEMSRLSPDQLAILAEIQAEEIALANAVIGCGGGPVQSELLLGDIRVEYEERFLEENADAVEEFRADG